MQSKSQAVFNPEALYQVGPQGLWVEDLVDISQDPAQKTGPIYLPPGTILGYSQEFVGD